MTKDQSPKMWEFQQAKSVSLAQRFILGVLVVSGIISIFQLADWWFQEKHIGNLGLFLLLSMLFWYGLGRLILIWINYLGIDKPAPRKAEPGLKVAIFTTSSPGEPLSMFDKTLEACARITYPHTTYLLDDTKDSAFREVAEKHGAVWLKLEGIPGAKAGKINAALALTEEDFILVMDPDHIPFPNFLDEVLGFFKDETVGFVQVSQAYYNQYRSFTAKGAAEQTYGFYGPTQMSLFSKNCSVAIGANCTFRRKALESAGGHGIGLAEDLITAIRIHSKGWKSIYNPVIVSRGLVPEDFGSFCKQQLKWARGVHEVLFAEVPRLFKDLSFWQKISYSTIGTYYLAGTSMFLYMLIPFFYLLFGFLPAQMPLVEFVQHGFPVFILAIVIYLYVQNWVCDPTEKGFHWRGMVLKFACWPVFFLGFILSLVNADIPYIPTAKKAVVGKITPFARPLIIHIGLFFATLLFVLYNRKYLLDDVSLVMSAEQTWGMMGFAAMSVILSFMSLYAVWESQRLSIEEPWEDINVNKIGAQTETKKYENNTIEV